MQNAFILITKLALCVTTPASSKHVILSNNSIMPNQPEPNLDFERDFRLPLVLKGSVDPIAANIHVH
jgi:hypothetical protein